MVLNFSITLLVMISLLLSLRFCTKAFEKFELVCLTLACSNLIQQFFYTFYSAFKYLKVKEDHLEFWISRMDVGGILPALLVWTLYGYRRTNSWWGRLLLLLVWGGFYVLQQKLRIVMGVYVDHGWQPARSLFRGELIALIGLLLMYVIRNRFQKEGLLDDDQVDRTPFAKAVR